MAKKEQITEGMTEALLCPVCHGGMKRCDGSLLCESRHNYDIARQGYVNLINTTSQKESGDSFECAQARVEFLSSGKYAAFRDAICEAAGRGRICIDAGCGEGYYTSALPYGFEYTYGFDLSKASITASARRANAEGVSGKCFFGVGSVYSLPMRDGSADVVTNIFAPCVEEEYTRVLRDGGLLVVGCAGERHLEGLKAALYDEVRENTTRADLPTNLEHVSTRKVTYEITLDSPELIRALYMMTPYAYKTSAEAEARLLSRDSLSTIVDFDIHVYKKRA